MPCIQSFHDFPVTCHERQIHTIVYGEKQAVLKALNIERKTMGWNSVSFEQVFEAFLGFDEALHLFFTKEFAEHVYGQLGSIEARRGRYRDNYDSISCLKFSVLRKIYDDFNDNLHPKDFAILETGMKLRANMVRPVSNYLPPDSTNLVISGTFEF